MEVSTEKSTLSQLREMKVGETRSFPVSKMSYIRMIACNFGLQWNMKFYTKVNREQKTINITREA